MFGLGAIALTLALNVLSDTTSQSDHIASGTELKQVGEIAAANIQEAVRVATAASGGYYRNDFDLAPSIGQRSYTIVIDPGTIASPPACNQQARVVLTTEDGDLTAEVPLGNAPAIELSATDCLDIGGSVHSSAGSARVIYDPSAEPEITLRATPR